MKTFTRPMTLALLAGMVCLLVADVSWGCPMCKEANAAHANIARGYFWSILFMLATPATIFTGMGSYFYWLVRKANADRAVGSTDDSR